MMPRAVSVETGFKDGTFRKYRRSYSSNGGGRSFLDDKERTVEKRKRARIMNAFVGEKRK